MKIPPRFWLFGAALLLGILLLTAAGCGYQDKPDGSLTFQFQVDPEGTTAGQLPVEAQEVDLAFSWYAVNDNYPIREEEHSFQVDGSQKHAEELTFTNDYGRFYWTAQAYGLYGAKKHMVAAALGNFYTAAYESRIIEVEFSLRDVTLILEVGVEDPEAQIYCFRIEEPGEDYDVATSPPIDSDNDPPAWSFSLPSGGYNWYASSYTAGHPDYPYFQDEDRSQTITGSVNLSPGETETIVVDFDPQPVPDPPSGVEAELTAAHADSILISWSAVPGADSYNLYWATTPGVTKAAGTKIAGVSSGYTHGPLPRGFTYYYVLTALKGLKESAESGEVSAPIPPG